MLIYIILILFLSLAFLKNQNKKREKSSFFLLTIILVGFFLTTSYMSGSDWRFYEIHFRNLSFHDLVNNDYRIDKGYVLYALLWKTIGINFWIFFISTKIFIYIIIIKRLKYFDINFSLFFLLFLPEAGLYIFIDTPFRTVIAFGLFLISSQYLLNEKPLKYFSILIVASFFHISAIFLLPLYYLIRLKYSNWLIITLFIVGNIIAFELDFMFNTLFKLASISELILNRASPYLYSENFTSSKINIGVIHRFLFLLFILYKRKSIIQNYRFGLKFFNLTAISFIIYPYGMAIFVLQRFNLYLSIFVIIVAVLGFMQVKNLSNKRALYSIIVAYTLLRSILLITNDYRYIPYTNYIIESIKGNNLNYQERSNYNYKNSPYAK